MSGRSLPSRPRRPAGGFAAPKRQTASSAGRGAATRAHAPRPSKIIADVLEGHAGSSRFPGRANRRAKVRSVQQPGLRKDTVPCISRILAATSVAVLPWHSF